MFHDEDYGQPFMRCPSCGQKVDPASLGVNYAVEMQPLEAFAGTEYVEGIGRFFHRECVIPFDWRARPKP